MIVHLGTETTPHIIPSEAPVMFYDGVCAMCCHFVRYIYRRDRSQSIRFVALQSEKARHMLEPFGADPRDMRSVLLLHRGQLYDYSDAGLNIAVIMGGGWRTFAKAALLTPKPLRDRVYRFVARNRYNWFGFERFCLVPSPDFRARILA